MLLAVLGRVWVWGLAIAGTGVASGLFYPRFFSSITASTPAALRAQVLTSVTIVISAPGSIGFVGAGLFGQQSTVGGRLLVAGAATVGAAIIALSPHRLGAARPEAGPDPGPSDPQLSKEAAGPTSPGAWPPPARPSSEG